MRVWLGRERFTGCLPARMVGDVDKRDNMDGARILVSNKRPLFPSTDFYFSGLWFIFPSLGTHFSPGVTP